MGDRLGIAHPIHALSGFTRTLGTLSVDLGGFTPAGIDLAGIRARLRGQSTTPTDTPTTTRPGGTDRLERVDSALISRTSMPWML